MLTVICDGLRSGGHPGAYAPGSPRPAIAAVLVLLAMPVLLTGCGYAVGSAVDPHIRTVAVPTFESGAFRRGVEQQLTEAVQREIRLRTPFRLAHAGDADTRLRGKVVSVGKRVLGLGPSDDPRQVEFEIAVEVVWEDLRDGRVLASRHVPISPDAVNLMTSGRSSLDVGQSARSAEYDAVRELARQIVDLMETPW